MRRQRRLYSGWTARPAALAFTGHYAPVGQPVAYCHVPRPSGPRAEPRRRGKFQCTPFRPSSQEVSHAPARTVPRPVLRHDQRLPAHRSAEGGGRTRPVHPRRRRAPAPPTTRRGVRGVAARRPHPGRLPGDPRLPRKPGDRYELTPDARGLPRPHVAGLPGRGAGVPAHAAAARVLREPDGGRAARAGRRSPTRGRCRTTTRSGWRSPARWRR